MNKLEIAIIVMIVALGVGVAAVPFFRPKIESAGPVPLPLTRDAVQHAAEMRVLGRQEGFDIGYMVAAEEFRMMMEGRPRERMEWSEPGEARGPSGGADRVGASVAGPWGGSVPAMEGGG